jgi:ectoine hydroxylase-related dioxygenase (phytanoyl-CoA dioxygenase family)
MSDDELYLFDLNGFIVVPEVLSADEVKRTNELVDAQLENGRLEFRERSEEMNLTGGSSAMEGTSRRLDGIGQNPLGWDRPYCEPFRDMIAHPKITPYLDVIVGKGFRLDAGPSLMGTDPGAEGHYLHNGGGDMTNIAFCYFFKNGRIFSGMVVVEIMLVDEGPDDGGVAVIPGSHKANLPCPKGIRGWESHREFVRKVVGRAGDAVIFTETLTHGALPWKGPVQRRLVLSRYMPGSMAWHGMLHKTVPPDYAADMTEEQRGMIDPPDTRAGYIRSVGG